MSMRKIYQEFLFCVLSVLAQLSVCTRLVFCEMYFGRVDSLPK